MFIDIYICIYVTIYAHVYVYCIYSVYMCVCIYTQYLYVHTCLYINTHETALSYSSHRLSEAFGKYWYCRWGFGLNFNT